ncbi:MAG: metal ABC transporter substrate-binding protein [Proteobacteria bacterium]|nr:metal ABC transporter substrate-binding protein [Pseudomonadota bacterium]MBI3498155.1 metal ABC transporter substrate-binding protein [Pseudomonadota bacterium]
MKATTTVLAILSAVILGWAAPVHAQAGPPIKVVASMSVLADIVRNIGGERLEVVSLVPPDGDAHIYEPTPTDSRAIAAAKLVVINGLGLEGWIDRFIKASGYKGRLAVASAGIKARKMEADDASAGGKAARFDDPHCWQDLSLGRRYVATIAAALIEADPANAEAYRAREHAYDQELARLDGWVRAEFASVPQPKRRIITSHDAFGYLGAAYGVTLLAPVGVSTESEPSAADVAKLIRQIRRDKVKAVFIENMTDTRLIEQIGRESGAVLGGTLYSDALSKPGGPADTYVKMFRHNVALLKEAMLKN